MAGRLEELLEHRADLVQHRVCLACSVDRLQAIDGQEKLLVNPEYLRLEYTQMRQVSRTKSLRDLGQEEDEMD